MNNQVELLLGKAYSDWGHISDAVSVYDRLISSHPNDFRGYLAKVFLFLFFFSFWLVVVLDPNYFLSRKLSNKGLFL